MSNYLYKKIKNKYMNNRMYTYTRKKHEYAYIYILAKNRTNWTHPPIKPSNILAS